jgi:hypothetical protein
MRLASRRFVLLCALMAALLYAASPHPSSAAFLVKAIFLIIMISLFRLWDDIADAAYDRERGVDRPTTQTGNRVLFAGVLIAGLAGTLLVFIDDPARLATFLALAGALAIVYHAPPFQRLPRAMRVYIMLGKYPVLLYLAGAPLTARAWVAAIIGYLVVAAFDTLDRDEMGRVRFYPHVVGVALAMLLVGALYSKGFE